MLFGDVSLGERRRLKEDKVPHLSGHLLRPVGKKTQVTPRMVKSRTRNVKRNNSVLVCESVPFLSTFYLSAGKRFEPLNQELIFLKCFLKGSIQVYVLFITLFYFIYKKMSLKNSTCHFKSLNLVITSKSFSFR